MFGKKKINVKQAINFNHDSDQIEGAIEGATDIRELLDMILKHPNFFGNKVSEAAEIIYNKADDPSALSIMSLLIYEGYTKWKYDQMRYLVTQENVPARMREHMKVNIKNYEEHNAFVEFFEPKGVRVGSPEALEKLGKLLEEFVKNGK